MILEQSYRKAFIAAVFFHLFLALALLVDTTTNQRPVMTPEAKNEPSQALPIDHAAKPKEEIVKAVSVDNKEVMETVQRLKQERANQLKAEQSRQQALAKQAEMARKARVQEQQRLAKLKEEADKLAIARKKQIEEEKRRLKELAEQKVQEAKRLEELKAKQQQLKKQQEEAEKLAVLKQKQAEEKLKADKLKEEKVKEELARADKAKAEAEVEKKRQAAALQQQAVADAAKKAQLAGEVDKYKAMIVNAISRQWILPENVDSRLSSQFRIRLAPDGAVLEVSLMRSSGDAVLDRSAQTAIFKASPLPVPSDPDTFNLFRDISLTVRPENVRG
ncbi:cell envelope integrity protein TolA [Legionella drozanskii]|uniref:TolA colicin import membrane protein n=1 Tax=Legionella drozanskii LLAP-1 TaxID=1212489 RepID=A0A0W0TDN4_9GAMM|nr:cell envelope integrity protein TolA [Legionella drozanskii]KTC93716.1 TolA colicin import membrane protein [Legionella drozanskii LLAP-1]